MKDINVDDFFNDAARALLTLYQAFPRPLTLFVEDICGPEEPDEFGMHSNRYLACFGALIWLGEEGFLRFENTINSEAIEQAVLTGRCFTLLLCPAASNRALPAGLPDSIRNEQSSRVFGLQEAVRHRSSFEIRTVMLDLLARMTGLGSATAGVNPPVAARSGRLPRNGTG